MNHTTQKKNADENKNTINILLKQVDYDANI